MKEKFVQIIVAALKKLWQDLWKMKFLIIGFLIYIKAAKLFLGAMCPMVIATGLPCPGCGMTRAAKSFITFDFRQAYIYNPTIFMWGAYIFYLGLHRYVLNKKVAHFVPVTTVVASITIGVYLYRMIYCFPGEAPMTYMYKNMFSQIIPGYKSLISSIWNIYTQQ